MKCGVNTCWVISSGLGNAGVRHGKLAEQSPFNSLGFRLECYFWSLDFFLDQRKHVVAQFGESVWWDLGERPNRWVSPQSQQHLILFGLRVGRSHDPGSLGCRVWRCSSAARCRCHAVEHVLHLRHVIHDVLYQHKRHRVVPIALLLVAQHFLMTPGIRNTNWALQYFWSRRGSKLFYIFFGNFNYWQLQTLEGQVPISFK